jgi:ribosomal protein L40E
MRSSASPKAPMWTCQSCNARNWDTALACHKCKSPITKEHKELAEKKRAEECSCPKCHGLDWVHRNAVHWDLVAFCILLPPLAPFVYWFAGGGSFSGLKTVCRKCGYSEWMRPGEAVPTLSPQTVVERPPRPALISETSERSKSLLERCPHCHNNVLFITTVCPTCGNERAK